MTTTETTQTTQPDALAAIYARYREIAPPADPESPDVAEQLARRLVVDSIRQDARCEAAILAGRPDAEGWAALCAGFTAAHLMTGYLGYHAAQASAQIATALQGGGDITEWLHEHALTLGVDPAEVGRLAEREAGLLAARKTADERKARDAAGALMLAQEALLALQRVADGHARVMYAASVDLSRGDPDSARRLLCEQLDGYDGPLSDGTESGLTYLSRTADRVKPEPSLM